MKQTAVSVSPDRLWMVKAKCSGRLDLPWIADRCPVPADLTAMHQVCMSQCPVLRECAQYALRASGAVGGFYAGVWLPWITYDAGPELRLARERGRRRLRVLAMGRKVCNES